MILLLLFSILSTIRASVAQKTKQIFFCMERSQQEMPLKIDFENKQITLDSLHLEINAI